MADVSSRLGLRPAEALLYAFLALYQWRYNNRQCHLTNKSFSMQLMN